ncbi:hypothetical protein ACLMJK_009415 [Lecanora helva]
MPLTRPRQPEANSAQIDPGARVIIKHPGYDDSENIMIILAGFDRNDGNSKPGLHFGTTSAICAIISGSHGGYFSKNKDGNEEARLHHQPDDLLEAGECYYHVPNEPQYAVYPSFEHWQFPHNDLPEPYTHSGPSSFSTGVFSTAVSQAPAEVMSRDKRCLISRQRDYKETCHLCPKKELPWFQRNNMRLYNTNSFLAADDLVNDTSNMVALRRDLHKAFDERFLSFVWKEHGWTTHFIKPTKDLGLQYHNMPVSLSDGISTQFLYTRLAWAVFPLVKTFLVSASKRWVTLRVIEKDGKAKWQKEYLDKDEISKRVPKSQSPLKRKLNDETGPEEMESNGHTRGDSRDSEATDSECWEDEDSLMRGRRRRRKFSDSSVSSQSSIGSGIKTQIHQSAKSELAYCDLSPRG